MEGYSYEVYDEIQNNVEIWCDAFAETESFKNLRKVARKNIRFITSVFSEYMYNYHLQTPDAWSVDALEEVICDIFPRKVAAKEELFHSVEPVLHAFFQYLNDNGIIKNSSELIEALRKSIPIMLKYINDSINWGLAKQLGMTAMQSGIDIGDKQEMYKLINNYNTGLYDEKPVTAVSGPKVGRNEPCPCGSGKKYKHCCGKTYNIICDN